MSGLALSKMCVTQYVHINKIKLIPKSGKLATFVKIIEYLPVHSFFLKRTGSIPEGSLQCSFDS